MQISRDQLSRVVFNIRTPVSGGEVNGTGIFVVSSGRGYLLTASHVAKSTASATYVIISDEKNQPERHEIAFFLGGVAWIHHQTADLAYAPITPTPDNNRALQNRFLPIADFNLTGNLVSKDDELTSIGFPLGLGVNGYFSPLTFRTFAASSRLTLPRFDTQTPSEFIVLENPSVGGYSGCPVVDLGYVITGGATMLKGQTICHGIMHGTIKDDTGGKMAAVTPASYLAGWIP